MADINIDTIRIIVENAMRTSKMGGEVKANGVTIDLENTWKTTVFIDGKPYDVPINYQNIRDAISQSILDSLTALSATGKISEGSNNAPNEQVVVTSSDININPSDIVNVNINTIDPLKGAARLNDDVLISVVSDPVFLTWITAVGSALSIPAPTSISGKISSSSDTVRIGD